MPPSSNAPEPRPGPLAGLRIVELPAFVAAPLAGMTLAQLGAEVIRIDPLRGGMDQHRWPRTEDGASLYWASLNKGKRSVALPLDTPEGQRAAADIICAAGEGGGIVVTNLPARGLLSYDLLSARRPDLIMMRLLGNHDGSPAVDYSVNCASGFPHATGATEVPVNHVLPAWDIAAGLYLTTGLLAAERRRQATGEGQEVTLALSDVMLATVGNLGYLADVQINGVSREPVGNALYGAFGRDFATSDGRSVMVVAITTRQFDALGRATGLTGKLRLAGELVDADLTTEGGRYAARHALAAVLEPWFAARTLAEVRAAFAGSGALWGPYQTFRQLVAEDERCSPDNPMFSWIEQPGVGTYLAPGSPLSFSRDPVPPARPAPALGADTRDVLAAAGQAR
ncbi:CoA transferase [Streptomyces sp. NPDC127033]|uniref:CoA transferase n=1 Tax=Streptomyces sp. NPDC127033 TaxID=3347110 RepID=UPI0036466552